MSEINHEERRRGIGGTDIGKIIGVNPFPNSTIMDLYLEKVGIVPPQEDNENMYWGREFEPSLRKRYVKETGHKIISPGHIHHINYEWYKGTPDDLVNGGMILEGVWKSEGGVDYKTTGRRQDYGEPGTDEVPEWIHTQASWYMGLTGAEWWDIAVLFFAPRREFHIYRIPRNQELIDNLIEAGRDFWENHVVPQVPPPIDESEGSKRLLNHLYPRETEDFLELKDDSLVELLKIDMERQEIISKEIAYTQNQLKEIIGSHAGVQTSLGKITWKKNKDSVVVDWMKSYMELSAYCYEKGIPINDEDFSGKNTTIKPGSRVFRAWWKKEE